MSLRTSSNTPNEFMCPISHEIMTNPVICADGYTYDRIQIETWFLTSNKSPMTNIVIDKTLVPNRALKETIERYTINPISNPPVVLVPSPKCILTYKAIMESNDMKTILLTINPPKLVQRKKVTIIFEIDISGSMGSTTDLPGKEKTNFTRLNLVQHSIITIISLLDVGDYMCIIVYSNDASILCPLSEMTPSNKNIFKTKINALEPTNSTNIWDAIRIGLEVSRNPICTRTNTIMMNLTDGEANINPPQGIINSIEREMKKGYNGVLSVFAFGYDLNSCELIRIVNLFGGSFVFIPGINMLATGILNNLATCLSLVTVKLPIEIQTSCNIINVSGAILKNEGEKRFLNLIMVQSDQPRDIIINMSGYKMSPVAFICEDETININGDSLYETIEPIQMIFAKAMDHMIKGLEKAIEVVSQYNDVSRGIIHIKEIITNLQKVYEEINDDRLFRILKDFESPISSEGQISKAFELGPNYNSWGKHYIRGIINAHKLNQRNNFIDNGVQIYGGELFLNERDKADEIFNTLAPPKPSYNIPSSSYGRPCYQPVYVPPVQNMSQFNSREGEDCFGGNGMVLMSDSSYIKVRDIKKGDKLYNGATVVCVISKKVDKIMKMVKFEDGLEITPYHPIQNNSEWVFPTIINIPQNTFIDCLYNFILDSIHTININGIVCCTLGHNITTNGVISHPFYGTHVIIDIMKKMDGYNEGLICMDKCKISYTYDTTTNMKSGYIFNK
jgi:hypothetical protein